MIIVVMTGYQSLMMQKSLRVILMYLNQRRVAHGADADRPVKCHSDLSERIKDEHKTSWANPPDSISISKTEMPS
ncbi:hypothetical protein cypCar_00042544 [Cyprinus carpio]|nr:hypothetical protein cypCar_00042544 [Cyprinus carpio]